MGANRYLPLWGLFFFSSLAQAITLLGVGDVLMHNALIAQASRSDTGFQNMFSSVKPYIEAADNCLR